MIGADDLRALAPARELGHEGTVDLQGVHRQAVEVAEARAAGAEVVDAHRKVEPRKRASVAPAASTSSRRTPSVTSMHIRCGSTPVSEA